MSYPDEIVRHYAVKPMLPNISVVIPLYNHEKYIVSTIYSVLAQHHPAREVIVIDDGSTDSGLLVVEALAKHRPEIVCWSHDNRGAHNTINAGIHRATSELVSILNSDDTYHPERLLKICQAFESDSELDVVVTGLEFIDGEGESIPFDWYHQAMDFHRSCNDLGKTLINGNIFVTTSNLVVRRSLFEEIGYFSNLRYAHDLDFFLRLVIENKKILIIEEPLMSYRIHDSNTISEGHLKVKLEWAVISAFYLSRLSVQPDGWSKISDYVEILKAHNLMDAVFVIFGYFKANPACSLENHPFHKDEAFKAAVRGLIS